jgi:hypothetical protein
VALLLNAGCTQAQVADALGVAASTVSEDVAAIEEAMRRSAETGLADKMAREEGALLEDELAVRLELAEADSTSARLRIYDTVLAIMRRRADLLGLDAQQRRKVAEMEAGQQSLDELLLRALGGDELGDEDVQTPGGV